MGHAGLPQSPAEGEESRRVAGVDVEDGREVTVATRYGVEGSPYEPVQTGQVAHGREMREVGRGVERHYRGHPGVPDAVNHDHRGPPPRGGLRPGVMAGDVSIRRRQ